MKPSMPYIASLICLAMSLHSTPSHPLLPPPLFLWDPNTRRIFRRGDNCPRVHSSRSSPESDHTMSTTALLLEPIRTMQEAIGKRSSCAEAVSEAVDRISPVEDLLTVNLAAPSAYHLQDNFRFQIPSLPIKTQRLLRQISTSRSWP